MAWNIVKPEKSYFTPSLFYEPLIVWKSCAAFHCWYRCSTASITNFNWCPLPFSATVSSLSFHNTNRNNTLLILQWKVNFFQTINTKRAWWNGIFATALHWIEEKSENNNAENSTIWETVTTTELCKHASKVY